MHGVAHQDQGRASVLYGLEEPVLGQYDQQVVEMGMKVADENRAGTVGQRQQPADAAAVVGHAVRLRVQDGGDPLDEV